MEPESLRPFKPVVVVSVAKVMKDYEQLTREIQRDIEALEEFVQEFDPSRKRPVMPLTDKDKSEFKSFMQKAVPQS